MTAPTITLSSPADLLAVIPRLLGFEPRASIVLISLRQRRIGLTQRMDIPGPDDVDRAARTMLLPFYGTRQTAPSSSATTTSRSRAARS